MNTKIPHESTQVLSTLIILVVPIANRARSCRIFNSYQPNTFVKYPISFSLKAMKPTILDPFTRSPALKLRIWGLGIVV